MYIMPNIFVNISIEKNVNIPLKKKCQHFHKKKSLNREF